MPLFRRKSDKLLPKASSLSIYGQGRTQTPPCVGNGSKSSETSSLSSLNMDDKPQAVLAFAEITFDPSLPMRAKSRLSKTLEEVLRDNSALAYFIQFMEAKKAKHLVKFWLEAESFSVSAVTRLRGQSQKSQTSLHETAVLPGPFPSSDSSGCVSDKSDDVFHPSSHGNSCDLPGEEKNISLNTRQKILCDTSEGPVECSKQTCHHGSKHSGDVCQSTVGSAEVMSAKSTDLRVPEGDVNAVSGKKPSRCSEDKYCSVNNVHTSMSVSSDASQPHRDWSEDAEAYFLGKPDSSYQSKDGLMKLQTSIEQDANYIYSKYIAQDAQFPIGISDELRCKINANICRSDGKVDPECFVPAENFVVQRMDKEYFSAFLRSNFHCKHQIDVLTSGNVYLADVLYNDSALFYFMEFMEQEGVRHLVDFLLMADNFHKHLLSQQGSYNGTEAQDDAMVLYDKYFSLQATSPLGFSDTIRYEVEQNICREEGPLPDCFLKPVMILMQYLEKTFLLQFLSSQLYFKYLSECIITIQSGGADLAAPSRYSGSDSGSEHSLPVTSVNTLLAMDSKQPGAPARILKNIGDQDMRIDTGQFKPDSLWRRHLAGKLQMAYVDNLGKFVTEFEPEPDRRKESRISKAVKKLVNWEEDRNQEDMAWQVAEMIIKDVCSVTMSNSSDDKEEKNPGVS